MFSENINVVDILQIGVIGLGFLLAVLSYHLLTKEQKQHTPRPNIINSIYVFMGFSLVLCVIGIFSQSDTLNNKSNANIITQGTNTSAAEKKDNTLFSYFADVDENNKTYVCSIGEFTYSEKNIDQNKTYIEGTITGKMKQDDNLVNGAWQASGYIDKYFLRISYDTGVAFLEHNRGDFTGYWIGETDDPEIKALICPWVLSPDKEGLSEENAKKRWPILNEPCRILQSLKDISK